MQQKLDAARRDRVLSICADAPSLLAGLIFDDASERLSPTHAVKKSKRYRYYVSTALITGGRGERPMGRRLPAGDVEALTLDRLRHRRGLSPCREAFPAKGSAASPSPLFTGLTGPPHPQTTLAI